MGAKGGGAVDGGVIDSINCHWNLKRKKLSFCPDVTQLVGHQPTKQEVTTSIPSQGTCLGCRFGSWLGCVQGA